MPRLTGLLASAAFVGILGLTAVAASAQSIGATRVQPQPQMQQARLLVGSILVSVISAPFISINVLIEKR